MSDENDATGESVDRPDAVLAGIGQDTWQAFNAMQTTKLRHYELLEVLDNKKKNYNLDPSDSQRVHLANLLKDHDEQVQQFTKASGELKQADSQAHISLFRYIGLLNEMQSLPEHRH